MVKDRGIVSSTQEPLVTVSKHQNWDEYYGNLLRAYPVTLARIAATFIYRES